MKYLVILITIMLGGAQALSEETTYSLSQFQDMFQNAATLDGSEIKTNYRYHCSGLASLYSGYSKARYYFQVDDYSTLVIDESELEMLHGYVVLPRFTFYNTKLGLLAKTYPIYEDKVEFSKYGKAISLKRLGNGSLIIEVSQGLGGIDISREWFKFLSKSILYKGYFAVTYAICK